VVVGNTVNIMRSNTKKDMKVIAEIVGAVGTRIKVWIERDTNTVVVVAGASNIMVV
jgi:hypothetical protein